MVNFGQTGDKHGPKEQVDVVGPPGPTRQCRPTPPRWCPAPPGAHLVPCHVSDPWELLLSQLEVLIQVSLINGHDEEAMDPWAHCHRLGASPTDLPAKFHHVLSSQPSLRSNQHPWMQRRCIQGPAGALLPPPGALGPPPTLPLPTNTLPSLYTINSGCGARWRSAPFNSKLSKLLLAF